jgi:hypothetical protein
MASRAEQKAKLRAEREERERQEREAAARRGRMLRLAVGAAVVVVAAIVAIAVLSGGDEKNKPKGPTDQTGLSVSPCPWPPLEAGVIDRGKKLGLPDLSDTAFHIHAQLSVYVDGKKQTVPQNIGIDTAAGDATSLHTHDTSGVIHMEATQPYKFKLGQFFTIWGVKFTDTQIGAYHPNAAQNLVLQTYVNGKLVKDPVNYVMKAHDKIVVGFGEPKSFPKTSNFKFPPNE